MSSRKGPIRRGLGAKFLRQAKLLSTPHSSPLGQDQTRVTLDAPRVAMRLWYTYVKERCDAKGQLFLERHALRHCRRCIFARPHHQPLAVNSAWENLKYPALNACIMISEASLRELAVSMGVARHTQGCQRAQRRGRRVTQPP